MKTKELLSEWLKSCDCTVFNQVKVTIGKTTYNGCLYSQDSGELRLYCLGSLPSSYVNHKAHYYIDQYGQQYFIGSYYQDDVIPDNIQKYHPFGKSFILMTIDDYTRLYYGRSKPKHMKITIEN